jgi:hypothetical protein
MADNNSGILVLGKGAAVMGAIMLMLRAYLQWGTSDHNLNTLGGGLFFIGLVAFVGGLVGAVRINPTQQ